MAFSEKTKLEVKKLSHQTCCLCKNIGIEIHHIIPQAENGPDNLDNAAPLCPSCHETYGQNPTKRKFIRESRDIWYEICEKKYKIDLKKLNEIYEKVNNIENGINSMISNKKSINSDPMTIGEIFDFINKIPIPTDTDELKNINLVYQFVFKTIGDPEDEASQEFNGFRDEFHEYFGDYFTKRLLLYEINLSGIDWNKGVTESQAFEFINMFNTRMALVMMNYDLDSEYKIETRLKKNGEFEYVTVE